MADDASVFTARTDRYAGMTVSADQIPTDSAEFAAKLARSVEAWRAGGARAVWVLVPVELLGTHMAPLLAAGFGMHHADPKVAVLLRWLPTDEPSHVPEFCHTYVGVGGLCIDEDRAEVLVISERFRLDDVVRWKLPGGHVDLGEWWVDAVQREVEEETGVPAQFRSIVSIRHNTRYAFQRGDAYIVCRMRPLAREVRADPQEIAAAQWLALPDFADDARVYAPNRMMIRAACGLPADEAAAELPLRRLVAVHAPEVVAAAVREVEGDQEDAGPPPSWTPDELERVLVERPAVCTAALRHMLRAAAAREMTMHAMDMRISHLQVKWQWFRPPPLFERR